MSFFCGQKYEKKRVVSFRHLPSSVHKSGLTSCRNKKKFKSFLPIPERFAKNIQKGQWYKIHFTYETMHYLSWQEVKRCVYGYTIDTNHELMRKALF